MKWKTFSSVPVMELWNSHMKSHGNIFICHQLWQAAFNASRFVRVSRASQGIKQVTKVSTICEVMNSSDLGKSMFTEVHKLLTIYLTVPMTSATAEQTFSSLWRLKNYLRSTMTQKRLNNVVLMHTHKECTDKVNLLSITKKFVTSNERRANYFGHYQLLLLITF